MIKFRDSKIFVGAVNAPSFGQWFGLPVSPRQVNQVLTNKGVIGPGIDNEELLIVIMKRLLKLILMIQLISSII